MLSIQFAIGEDAHDLAACAPWNCNIFKIGLRIVRQNHECGELVGIDEKRDALDVFLFGFRKVKRLHDDVLRRNVAHWHGFKETAGDICILEVALTVREIVRKVSVAPSCGLFPHAVSFFGMVIPSGEEMAEPVDASGEGLVAVAEPETHAAAPAPISLAVEGSDPPFGGDRGKHGYYTPPSTRFELYCPLPCRVRPREGDRMRLQPDSAHQFAFMSLFTVSALLLAPL